MMKLLQERPTQRPAIMHNLAAGACIAVAVAGVLILSGKPLERRDIRMQYERLAQMAHQTAVPEKMDSSMDASPIDFEKLSEINPDVAGWIRIWGTGIDYPIVQGRDNHGYMHKSFSGEEADAGCIFLDFESQRDMRGYHTILYGHNMKDGTMFRDLVRYKDEEYFKEHPYFEIYTPEETIHLKAVACYYIQEPSGLRRTKFRDEEDFQTFVRRMLEPCPYADMPREPVESLYTLVTCSYEADDARTLLLAVETPQNHESQ